MVYIPKLLVILSALIGIFASDFNVSLLLDVLKLTAQYHNYTNVPIFLDNRTNMTTINTLSKNINMELLKVQYVFDVNYKPTDRKLLRDRINNDTVCLMFCHTSRSKIWKTMDKVMRKLRRIKIIVIIITDVDNQEDRTSELGRIFQRLWQLQFLQALVLWENMLYTYKPYPTVSFYRITHLESDPFPPLYRNLHGYTIATSVNNDIPRIFCFQDAQGKMQVRGFGYQIFRHFVRRLNATLDIINLNASHSITSSVNMSNILRAIGAGQIEITMHPYTGIKERQGILGYSIFKVDNCLIVPVRNEIPRYMYLLRPFEWRSWLLIGIFVPYVTFILSWTSDILPKNMRFAAKWSRCFLESVAQLLHLPTTFVLHAPSFRYVFIHCLLFLFGTYVTIWYSNLLGSYLTTFLVGDQIDTFEDLIAQKFPILAKDFEKEMLLDFVPAELVSKVAPLIVPVNASVQVSHLLSFNTSFGYPYTEERWLFWRLQQQYAARPIYRWSRICFGMPRIGYPMRRDSHLEHPMTEFIMDVQSAGLDHYWLVADFDDALRAGFVRLVNNSLTLLALDLDSLRVAWCVIVIGWLVSFLIFLGEQMSWHEIKRRCFRFY